MPVTGSGSSRGHGVDRGGEREEDGIAVCWRVEFARSALGVQCYAYGLYVVRSTGWRAKAMSVAAAATISAKPSLVPELNCVH